MRDVLGVKAMERRLEMIEGSIQTIAQQPAEAPQNKIILDAVQQLAPPVLKILEGLAAKLVGIETEKSPESILWAEVEKRYDQRKRAEMSLLADKILGGTGLIVEDVNSGDIGKPDGGKVK
jgi:hypothetical protein